MKAAGLRIEDLALAGWNVAGIPLVAASALAPVLSLGSEPNVLAGIVQLLAVIAGIVAVATRPPGSPAWPRLEHNAERLAFIGPLVGAVAFVSGSASAYLGWAVDGIVIGAAAVAVVGAMVFGDRLPVVGEGVRRALIFPFIAICAGIFNGFAAEILDGLDVGALLSMATIDDTGFGLFVIGMLTAGLAAFYAALVVAPRVLVDPGVGSGWLMWPARFVLYIVSAVLGIGWLGVI